MSIVLSFDANNNYNQPNNYQNIQGYNPNIMNNQPIYQPIENTNISNSAPVVLGQALPNNMYQN